MRIQTRHIIQKLETYNITHFNLIYLNICIAGKHIEWSISDLKLKNAFHSG